MKTKILIITILMITLGSCTISEGDVVTSIVRDSETRDFIKTQHSNAYVPHNLYQIGDTIKFCK